MFERLSASQRKLLGWIGVLAAIGIGLMLIQAPPLQVERPDAGSVQPQASSTADVGRGYAAQIEQRLKQVLTEISGAGAVEVFVTLERGSRLVIAEAVTEEKRDGETRVNRNPIILRAGGSAAETPLILETHEPELRGVLIVAEGAGNPHTRYQILRAAQAVLQLPAYKIEVLPKSKGKR